MLKVNKKKATKIPQNHYIHKLLMHRWKATWIWQSYIIPAAPDKHDSTANNVSHTNTPHEDEGISKALHTYANGSMPHVGTLRLLHRVVVDVNYFVEVPCCHLGADMDT